MRPSGGYQTKQRAQILDYFIAHAEHHVTAVELLQAFATLPKPISLATIYRQLERLESEGLVRRYTTDERGGACWQYCGGHACTTHFHLKCTECGTLIHVTCDYLDGIGDHILSQHGFVVDHSRTVFYGVCEQCRAKLDSCRKDSL